MLGYDQNAIIDSIFIKFHNELLYYCQPFHNPTCVECLGLDSKVEYTNAYQGIMPESHNISVQYMQSEESDLDNTFQGQILCFPVLYFSWTPWNQILQFKNHLPAGKAMSTFCTRFKMTQQCIIRHQAQEYGVVTPTKYNDLQDWADCVDRVIWVVKPMNEMHIVAVGAIVELACQVWETAASSGIDILLLVNNHVIIDTYWTVN